MCSFIDYFFNPTKSIPVMQSKERAFCQSIKQTRMLEMFLHESISVSVRAFHCIIYIICFISNLFHINCQIENISFTDMPSSLNMFPSLEIYDSTKWLCSNNLDGSLHTICKGSYKGKSCKNKIILLGADCIIVHPDTQCSSVCRYIYDV